MRSGGVLVAVPVVASGKEFQLRHIASLTPSSCSSSVVNLKFAWLSSVGGGRQGGLGALTVNQALPFVQKKEQEIRQEVGVRGER